MDYVEGTDAGQLVKDRYPAGMPVQDVCAIVTAIADALDYAHKRGLLHRDVKPANILLTEPEDGKRRILLADFGIARPLGDISGLTATNFTVGTLAYAAPEQLMGADIDGRADQYALAATAYHLLTGIAAVPSLQSGGRNQPPSQRAGACPRRHATRTGQARPCARGGLGQGSRRSIYPLRRLRPRFRRASRDSPPSPRRADRPRSISTQANPSGHHSIPSQARRRRTPTAW